MDFKETNLCAHLEWIDGPHDGKPSHFVINFWEKGDHNHVPVSPAFDMNIYSWMTMNSGMNHGGPRINWEETSVGTFESFDAKFFMGSMKGYWEVRVDLVDENGNKTTAAVKVPLKGGSTGGGHHGGHH